MVFGQPVYNTEQRRAILGQMKQYLDKEWLRKRTAGLLIRKNKKFDTVRFPVKKRKRIRRIKRNNLRPFRVKIIIIIRRRRRRR